MRAPQSKPLFAVRAKTLDLLCAQVVGGVDHRRVVNNVLKSRRAAKGIFWLALPNMVDPIHMVEEFKPSFWVLCPESGVILRCQCNDECTVTNCCDRRGDGCGGRFAGWWCCAMLNGADFFPTCLIYLLSPRLAPPWTPALTMVRLVV
jgi:hypothetical protein